MSQTTPGPPAEPDAAAGLGKRAVRYSAVMLLVRTLSRLIALVGVLATANVLGAYGFGELQTAVTLGALVGTVTDLGFTTLYVREGARKPQFLAAYFNNVASVKLIIAAISLPLLFLVLYVAGIQSLLLPGFALLVTNGYSQQLRNSLYALQRLKWEIVEIVPETLLLVGLFALGWMAHADSGYYLWAYAASYFAACIYFLVLLIGNGTLKPRWALDLGVLRDWLRAGFPLAITYVLTTVYFKLDVPILQHFRGYDEVGWYTVAYKPFEALTFLPLTLRMIAFPVFSIYFANAAHRVRAASEKLFKALWIMGAPITVGIFVLAPQYSRLLHLFPQSAPALQILALAIVFMFADNTFPATLNAIDRQKLFAYVAISGLVINTALNIVLIPRFGYLGASWATTVTEILLMLIGLSAARRHVGSLRPLATAWRPALAAAAMGAGLWALDPQGAVPVVGWTVAGAAAYLLLLWLLRVVDDEEQALLRQALVRR